MTDLKPITVYDRFTWPGPEHPQRDIDTLEPWAAEHGIDLCKTYSLEIYVLDAPFARVYAYQYDADGNRVYDPAARDDARLPPRDVLLNSLPPIQPYPPRNYPGDDA
jgi:hypothetical protein